MEYCFIKDRIMHRNEASISVFDLGLLRGYGVFDFFKVHDGVAVFGDDHIERFLRSGLSLHLVSPFNHEAIKDIVGVLIEKNQMKDGTVRLVLTGGISSNGFSLDGKPELLILPAELSFRIYSQFEQMKPYRLMQLDYVRETPQIKSLNYLIAMLHWPQVVSGGFDDVVYMHDGLISETSRANIFFVTRENVLITPKENILFGITRKYIISLARDIMEVEERAISWEEALDSSEAFISSTTKQVMPVVQLGDRLINGGAPGIYSKKLFDSFYDFELNHIHRNKKHLV